MRVSRPNFKLCLLALLGLSLLATAWFLLSRPRLPPYARLEAIEARFAPQIERLRMTVLTSTGAVTVNETLEQEELDRKLFDVPGILSAQAQMTKDGWKGYGPGFDYVRGRAWFVRRPAPGSPVVHKYVYQLKNGAEVETVQYSAMVALPDGSEHVYQILFDLNYLRSRWEAEGGEEEE